MSLDEEFGPCAPAGGYGVNAIERNYRPQSLQQLTADTAPVLKSYLGTADLGLSVPRILHRTNNILWIVDRRGDLWFAVEEIVDAETGALLYTLPRTKAKLLRPDEHVKLGHPSLLQDLDRHARIGGEILWSPRYNAWTLNNSSGRYGDRKGTTRAHLEAVARKLNHYGIELIVVFWEP